MVNKRYVVEGISSKSDVKQVEDALLQVQGVEKATVDLGSGIAELSLSVDISTDELNQALEIFGDYSLVAAKEYQKSGGERWEWVVPIIPLLVIGLFIVGLVLVWIVFGNDAVQLR